MIILSLQLIQLFFTKQHLPMKKITTLIFPIFLMVVCASTPKGQVTKPAKFTDANFQKTDLNKKGVTVVEFWATWCGHVKWSILLL